MLAACFSSSLLLLLPQGADKGPAALDRSGIQWVHKFDAALEKARQERRILFIVPNTWEGKGSGDFGPGLENFRVGVLCDERVRRLVNRRFVPYYCNVFEGAPAFDPDALKFIVKEKKIYGKETQTFTGGNPLLFMAPNGKLLGEVLSVTTADHVLAKMTKLLGKHRIYAQRSRAEKGLDRLERARMFFDLGDLKRAKQSLKGDDSVAGKLLLARMARADGRWKAHARILKTIEAAEAMGDVLVERAYRFWKNAHYKELTKLLAGFPSESSRITEARYLEGLGHQHAGSKDKALAVWKKLVQSSKQDAWVYRADWAFCEVSLGPREKWAYGKEPQWPSLLDRKSYLGYPNPDVERNKRR